MSTFIDLIGGMLLVAGTAFLLLAGTGYGPEMRPVIQRVYDEFNEANQTNIPNPLEKE